MSVFKDLNDVKLDINDFDEVPLSKMEQRRITKKVQNKIVQKNGLKLKKKSHILAAIATFFIASSVTLSVAFPSFAAKIPFIGNIFDLFVDDERYIFEEFDEHSTDIGVTKESNGISITLTNAVYDGENITIAYTIKSEQDLGKRPVLSGEMVVDELGDRYKDSGYFENYIVEKINDHEYAVLYIYELLEGPKPDTVHVTWQGDLVENLSNVNQFVSGDWAFQFSLEVLDNHKTHFKVGEGIVTDDGVEVEIIKTIESPISTTIYLSEAVDVRKVSQEQEEWRGVLIEYLVTDNFGKQYKYIHFRGTGHSTDFQKYKKSYPRITTNVINEEVTSLKITPIVTVYEIPNPDGNGDGFVVPVSEPYEMEPIIVPFSK